MKNKKTAVLLIIIAVLAVLVIILLVNFMTPKESAVSESSGVSGVIQEGWDSGIDTGGVEPAGIQVPGYKSAKMKSGDKVLTLSIGNPEVNEAGFIATLMLEDGTELYRSELIKPGYGITEIPLEKTLEPGEYNAYVLYQVVSLDEEQTPMNSVRSTFTLYVE